VIVVLDFVGLSTSFLRFNWSDEFTDVLFIVFLRTFYSSTELMELVFGGLLADNCA